MKEDQFRLYMSPAGEGDAGGGSDAQEREEQFGDEPGDALEVKDEESEDDDDPDKDLDDDDDAESNDDDDDDVAPKGGKRNKEEDDTQRIARIAAGVAAGMHARQPQERQQAKPLTDAEVKKLLNVYEIDNDTVKEMLGIDADEEVKPSQLKAAQRMVAGIIKNATTVSNATTTAQLRKLEERLSQYDQFMAVSREEQVHNRFFSRYDYLKPYEQIVKAVATSLSQSTANWDSLSFDEGARMVAKEVRKIVKAAIPGATFSKRKSDDDANHGADSVVRSGGVPRMAALAGSGRSSTSGQRGKSTSDDEAVYGPGNKGW